jgi:hypothetical protein
VTKTVLIVSCTNGAEEDIADLCTGLKQKKDDKGHLVKCVSFTGLQTLCKSKTKCPRVNEICFAGHSGFHRRNEGGSLTARKIAEREIGPYPLEEVAKASVDALTKFKTDTFKFFACESAVNEITYHRNDGNVVKIKEKFSTEEMEDLSSLIENKEDSKISSIQYVAMQLFNKLSEMGNHRQVCVVGVNGVGYMIPGYIHMRGFDIEHAADFKAVASEIKKAKDLNAEALMGSKKKKVANLQQQKALKKEAPLLHKFIEDRESAHKIEYAISLDKTFKEAVNQT